VVKYLSVLLSTPLDCEEPFGRNRLTSRGGFKPSYPWSWLRLRDSPLNNLSISFPGDVWPGPCAFPDFTIERVRTWWAGLIAEYSAKGVDGIWNDMNEPAVFKVSHTRRIVISQQLFTSRIIYAIHRPYPQSRFLAIASVDFVWRCQ
jgi:hypothetical protein